MRNQFIRILFVAISLIAGVAGVGVVAAGGLGMAPSPVIVKTAVDTSENVLIISGRHFGVAEPTVMLADRTLDVKRFSEREVVASLPPDFGGATYGVTVTTGGRNRINSNVFSATLHGADGK